MHKTINKLVDLNDPKELENVNEILTELLKEIEIDKYSTGQMDLDIMEISIAIRLIEKGEDYNQQIAWLKGVDTIRNRIIDFTNSYNMKIEDAIINIMKKRGNEDPIKSIKIRRNHKIEMINGIIVAFIGETAEKDCQWVKENIDKSDKETTYNYLKFIIQEERIKSDIKYK